VKVAVAVGMKVAVAVDVKVAVAVGVKVSVSVAVGGSVPVVVTVGVGVSVGVTVAVEVGVAVGACTAVSTLTLLFGPAGSPEVASIVTTFWTGPGGVTPGPSWTTRLNCELPVGSDAMVHVTVPGAPTAGVTHPQPTGAATDAKVVPLGSESLSDTLDAASGPRFWTVTV